MVTVTDTAPIAGQNDEREQKSMNRETYETYSAAEPEKIDLIAFLAEYFQAFQKFFFGVLALVILAGGGSFLTAKLRYQPVYEAYTSFVVGSNRAVGYSYYDNVTAEQLGKTFPYLVTSGVLKDVVARDLGIGAVTSEIQASVMENTNLFTIRVQDASPETAYRVMKSVITNYPEVAEYIIGATTLTVVDESGVPAVPVNSQDALRAGTYGAAAGLAAAFLLLFLYVRTRKTIHWADDIKKLTNAAFLGNLPQAKIKKRSSVKEQTITICNPKVPDAFKEAVQLIRTRTEDRIIGKNDCPVLLVTSAVPGEGKTTVAVNLAEAFAKKKYRVVLLDGDLRNPSVMKCMGLIGRKERGIAAVLKGQMDWEEALTDCRDLTLKILPGAGSTQNPAGLLRSVRMKTMIESLKEEADLLIIDTPPCGVLSDAALFGGIADGAVLVVHQGYAILVREEFSCLEFIMNRDTINWILKKTEYRRSNMEHLPKKIHQNGISYTLVGDYYIPDLKLPEESRPIGRWGRMHKAFLQEHRPGQYNALLLSGKLWTYLADLNEQAADRLACIVSQMQEAEGVTEELKARDQLAWVGGMNSIRSRAEEIILSEMIFV